MLQLGIITVLPEIITALHHGITGRAIKQGLVQCSHWNPRDWANTRYRQVDDKPYGGGPGMVMMYEPLHAAILHARTQLPANCKTIYVAPEGRRICQADLNKIVKTNQSLLFVAGRYEGIDERLITNDIDDIWSLGDFVLSGGEIAAMAFMDAIIRLIPGSLGHPASSHQDSFMNGLLDHPHYTRPMVTDNNSKVPDVLISGHHNDIERWRKKQALGRTWLKRPELLETLTLSQTDEVLLNEFKEEYKSYAKP